MNKILKMLGKKQPIEMDSEDFVKEHRRLIDVLRSGNKIKLHIEALKQERELKEHLKGQEDED